MTEVKSEMDDIFAGIRSDANPASVDSTSTGEDLFKVSAEDAERRRTWTNECELVALCSKGPNNNEYALNELGLKTVKAITEGYKDQELPIKQLEKPSVPVDGYQIKTPDGVIEIHKDKALSWLLSNTLGKIRGGKKGYALVAETPKNQSLTSKKAIKAQPKKISASRAEDILPTWEKKTVADNGEPLTHGRTVALVVEVPEGQKAPNVRGRIEDYPIFVRQEKYVEALGTISTSSSSTATSIINKGREQEQAVAELKRLMNVAQQENIEF